MKQTQNRLVHYILYLCLLFAFTGLFIVSDFHGSGFAINFANISLFIEFYSLFILLVFSFIILLGTKSLKSFFLAFPLALKKQSNENCKNCLSAVKTAMIASVIGAMLSFLINLINLASYSELTNFSDYPIYTCFFISILSIFYALIICAIILPIYIFLKRDLNIA